MSMHPNSAYMQAPPPATSTTATNNLVNGITKSPMMLPTNGQPPMPTQQQQQQFIMQQKLQIQQQQQQQQTPFPPSAAITNMNMGKFLPSAVSSPPLANFAQNQLQKQLPPIANLNGPLQMPTTTAMAQTTNNIPPHLRPPGSNGTSNLVAPLTNGGANSTSETSANSSRTASPALHAARPAVTTAATASTMLQQRSSMFPPPPHLQNSQQNPKFSAAPTLTSPSNFAALSSGMQNLNINRQNGVPQMPPQPLQQHQQQQQSMQTTFKPATSNATAPPSNFQHNFKTSALNDTSVGVSTPTSITQVPTSIQQPQVPMMPPTLPTQPPQQHQPFQQPPPPPFSSAAQQQGALTTPLNANQSLTTNSQTSHAAIQQNQLNNKPQLPQSLQPPQSTQRRPMYPTQMAPVQQSAMPTQVQPYAQVYHQQIQQQSSISPPGLFNGQPSTGPLQYQTQPPMPTHQQHQFQQQPPQQQQYAAQNAQFNQQPNVMQQGFNQLWGQDTIDLMQNRHILTPNTLMLSKIVLHNQFAESINCNPNIMRCTIAKIPESNTLLQKSRLPLGIVIHPFRDINSLPVIQCPSIVRCRLCRTYINPFVHFVDSKMWKCNLCYRTNELPEDFQFDPATKTYGDVTRRPEVRSSTIEFIAPSEYMLRPPQPAIYLFLFDVSIIAQQCGYLDNVCAVLNKHLEDMPGDARAQVGFIAYNSQVHFYSMAEGYNQPHEMTLLDIDDPFLPRPDNLLVNLKECKELVKDLLTQLPKRFADTHDPGSALGAALQVAYKLMHSSGGRITVFQTCLPNKGPGALEPREDPNNRSAKDIAHLNPATDFYKRYALECSGFQIAVDLFLLNQQYTDLATISGISKHSGGCVHHFPLYQKTKPQQTDSLKQCLKRYLTRKIGFEAVMRIRCTRGLNVHTFHGNFFVRSTDLLSLPNVNPDAGYGMQISYEETLTDVKTICFQAALLYTNSEGERRIRVHTLCLPVTPSLPEIMHAADTEAIVSLLSKMAVDRSLTSNVSDARDAFLNATVDIFNAFKIAQNLPSGQSGQLIAPRSLALLPLYVSALLKHRAFRIGTSTRLDDRVFAMDCMKTLPLDQLMKYIYPEFYQIDVLFYENQNLNAPTNSNSTEDDDYDNYLPDVTRLQLSAEFLDSRSIFLLDCGTLIIIYVGLNVPADILEKVFGIKSTAELPDYCYGLPNLNSCENDALRRFMMRLNEDKPYAPTVQIIRDTSTAKPEFVEKLVDDRNESSMSYYEFLQYIRSQVK